jgi:hypothetical protein
MGCCKRAPRPWGESVPLAAHLKTAKNITLGIGKSLALLSCNALCELALKGYMICLLAHHVGANQAHKIEHDRLASHNSGVLPGLERLLIVSK